MCVKYVTSVAKTHHLCKFRYW